MPQEVSLNNIQAIESTKSTDYLLVLYDDDGVYTWRKIAYSDMETITVTKADIVKYDYSYADLSLSIDNNPRNGVVTVPISSNWAYDHVNNQTAHWSKDEIQDSVGEMLDDGTVGDIVFTYNDSTNTISATVEDSSAVDTGSFLGSDLTDRQKTISHNRNREMINFALYKNGVEVGTENRKVDTGGSTEQITVTVSVPVNDSDTFKYIIS
jgi:hypothetical protein